MNLTLLNCCIKRCGCFLKHKFNLQDMWNMDSIQISVNTTLKTIWIIGLKKAFCRQKIPESCCTKRETINIHYLITSRNGERKIYATYPNNEWTCKKNKQMESVQSVQMNIYQSNTYRKDLSWQHFNNQPRVQQKQQVYDQEKKHTHFCNIMKKFNNQTN